MPLDTNQMAEFIYENMPEAVVVQVFDTALRRARWRKYTVWVGVETPLGRLIVEHTFEWNNHEGFSYGGVINTLRNRIRQAITEKEKHGNQ